MSEYHPDTDTDAWAHSPPLDAPQPQRMAMDALQLRLAAAESRALDATTGAVNLSLEAEALRAEVIRLHRIAVREPEETEAEVKSLGNRTAEACRAIDVWHRRASLRQKARQVNELRAALEWYGDRENHTARIVGEHWATPVEVDDGSRARAALGGGSPA